MFSAARLRLPRNGTMPENEERESRSRESMATDIWTNAAAFKRKALSVLAISFD